MGSDAKFIKDGTLARAKIDAAFESDLVGLSVVGGSESPSTTWNHSNSIGRVTLSANLVIDAVVVDMTTGVSIKIFTHGIYTLSVLGETNFISRGGEYKVLVENIGTSVSPLYRVTDGWKSYDTTRKELVRTDPLVIESDDIIQLYTTGQQLKAASGAGILDNIIETWVYVDFGGTAYTGGSVLNLLSGTTIVGTCDCLGATSSGWYKFTWVSAIPETNAALTVKVAGSNPATGNGAIGLISYYDPLDVAIFTFPSYGVAPDPPTDVFATVNSSTSVTIDWVVPGDDGGSAITGYKIERNKNQAGFTTLVADTGTTAVTYDDDTLSSGDDVQYKIYAINAVGTSTASVDVLTYGNTAVGASSSGGASTARRANSLASLPAGVTVQSISIHVQSGDANGYLGLYDDNTDKPDALLGATATNDFTGDANEWVTVDLITPYVNTTAQKVWMSWVFDAGEVLKYDDPASGNTLALATTSDYDYASGMRDPFSVGTASMGTLAFSIYLNVTTEVTTP